MPRVSGDDSAERSEYKSQKKKKQRSEDDATLNVIQSTVSIEFIAEKWKKKKEKTWA